MCVYNPPFHVHPGRLTWNLQITHLESKMIFQASMIMFHVNLPGCMLYSFLMNRLSFPDLPSLKPTAFFAGWHSVKSLDTRGALVITYIFC